MKAIIYASVSAAALLYAGAASAQSYPYYQAAESQTTADASASIDQRGDRNTASTTQGHSPAQNAQNTSVIVQGFGDNSANNSSASVLQIGSGQRALTMQIQNNTSTISQSGANNDAFAYQTGTGNSASTTQTQSSALHPNQNGGNQFAGVGGAGSVLGGQNLANKFIDTTETQGEALMQTRIIGPTTPVSGSESASYIVQATGANGNSGTVSQAFAGERALIVQVSYENGSTANITQSTAGDQDAFVHQGNGGFNSASINQTGNGASGMVYQDGAHNSIGNISQSGQSGRAVTVQSGQSEQSYTNQTMAFDQAKTVQSGGYNYSNISQTGNNATGTVTQSSNGSAGNTSNLFQSATNDVATITQSGQYNNAFTNQNLNNSWAHVSQTGNTNTSTVYQRP